MEVVSLVALSCEDINDTMLTPPAIESEYRFGFKPEGLVGELLQLP